MKRVAVLAIDPSLTNTGYACVDGKADAPRCEDAGRIRSGDGTLIERCKAVARDIAELEEAYNPKRIVIEWPEERSFGKQHKAATIRSYGVLCGFLAGRFPLAELVSVTVWTKGYPATWKDKYKQNRVSLAARLYRLRDDALGAKTVAGDVADALLLAHWALQHRPNEVVMEHLMNGDLL